MNPANLDISPNAYPPQHLVPLNMPEEQKQKLLQEDQEETYEISAIRNHGEVPCELESAQTGNKRKNSQPVQTKLQLKVRWKGYSTEEDSFVDADQVHADPLKEQYRLTRTICDKYQQKQKTLPKKQLNVQRSNKKQTGH